VQVVWYMVMGGIALATPYVSFRELRRARSLNGDSDDRPADEMDSPDDPGGAAPGPGRRHTA
jgi:hypothetical protein